MSETDAVIDGMDWGPGGVVEGTAEAEEVKIQIIKSVLEQNGASAAEAGELEASMHWRCGTLRSTEPDAAVRPCVGMWRHKQQTMR